jgi:hypothetical protein
MLLTYKGKDSKALTVLVGVAKLAADLIQPLGWGVDAMVQGHPSDHVLSLLMAFGCFEPDTDDPLEVEFMNGAKIDIVGICRAVQNMPEYTKIVTAGICPECCYY